MSETRTVRIYEEDYAEITRLADMNDIPARDVVRDLMSLDDGSVVGYCPEHGVKFVQSDVKSPVLSKDHVVCPEKFKTGRAEERAHEFNGCSNRIPLSELADRPPGLDTGEGDEPGENENEESDDLDENQEDEENGE